MAGLMVERTATKLLAALAAKHPLDFVRSVGGSAMWTLEQIEKARRELYSAVLSDTLDAQGYPAQFFGPEIRPLDDGMVLCGRARTGQYTGVVEYEPGEDPYELEIALVDDLKLGDVVVLSCFALPHIVPWGELLTTASLMRGATGCVTDGLARDSRQICELGFPVFSAGVAPLDTRGRGKLITMDRAIVLGHANVRPGDLVFGDRDGALVIPAEIAEETLSKAFEKVQGENRTRRELKGGAKLADVYAKYGIL